MTADSRGCHERLWLLISGKSPNALEWDIQIGVYVPEGSQVGGAI